MQNTSRFLTWSGSTNPREGTSYLGDKKWEENFFEFESKDNNRIRVINDIERGNVWEIYKPSTPSNPDDYRCELNGIIINETPYQRYEWVEGGRYLINWSSKLSAMIYEKDKDFVIFQWKSYDYNGQKQNYPFLFRVERNVLQLIHVTEGQEGQTEGAWIFLWSRLITPYEWFDISLEVLLSKNKDKGKLSFTFNGEKQVFTKDQYDNTIPETYFFTGRTLDTSGNTPKWGYYNRGVTDQQCTHWLDRMYIKQTGLFNLS